jgi:hypothetical protein
MSNILKKVNLNLIILLLLLSQFIIFFFNPPTERTTFNYRSDSLEKFTTMILGEKGVDVIAADKMIKINDDRTLLVGNTSLKNNEYEISSQNVTIDSQNKITSSSDKTQTINHQGTLKSEGFEYDQNTDIIRFNGESEFYSNED